MNPTINRRFQKHSFHWGNLKINVSPSESTDMSLDRIYGYITLMLILDIIYKYIGYMAILL